MLSVERLDYIKALAQKVEAIAALLAPCPELRGHLQFRFVCPPPESGITAYDATRHALERRITEVNRAWSTSSWQPIDYLPRSLPFAEMIDHYLAADVFWVTSLQDGMNLGPRRSSSPPRQPSACPACWCSPTTPAPPTNSAPQHFSPTPTHPQTSSTPCSKP